MYKVRGKVKFVKKLTGNFRGMTIFPYILLSDKYVDPDNIPPKLLRHENTHIFQEVELALILFYIMYYALVVYYFPIAYVKYALPLRKSPDKTWWKVFKQRNGIAYYIAYRMIWFEREAYANDQDPDYLLTRKPYSFFKYWKKRPGNKY